MFFLGKMFSRKSEAIKAPQKPPEPSKFRNPDDKTLGQSSPALGSLGSVGADENKGLSACTSGKEGLGDGGLVGVVNTSVVETEMFSAEESFGYRNVVDFPGTDSWGGVEGSEIDGVGGVEELFGEDGFWVSEIESENEMGSVLEAERLQAGNLWCFHGVGPAAKVGVEESKNSNMMWIHEGKDVGHEGSGFSVGDFVWAKIKSYPWWPGQIYDPSVASESAVKHYEKGKFLVAFSDNTFSWCKSSQLKSFEEDFYKMLKQSKSKSFHSSVEKALSDIGKLLELKMTCRCISKGNLVAENTGIKEGVFVPEGRLMFFNSEFEPAYLVSKLKNVARAASSATILDSLVLEAVVSAFYRAKGGYQVPEFYEPEQIPGLEHEMEEELSEVVLNYGALEFPVQSNLAKGGTDSAKLALTADQERTKANDEADEDCINALISISRMKESKVVRHFASPESKISSGDSNPSVVGNVAIENGLFSTEKKVDEEQNKKGYALRSRKKSKYLSPPYADPIHGLGERMTLQTNLTGEHGMKHDSLSSSSPYPMNIKLPANDVSSEIRDRALPLYQDDKETHNEAIGMYRISTYLSGSLSQMYKEERNQQTCGMAKCASPQKQPGRKRKSMNSEPGFLCKDLNQNDSFVTQSKSPERKIGKNSIPGANQYPPSASKTQSLKENSQSKASSFGKQAKTGDDDQHGGGFGWEHVCNSEI